MITTDVAQPQRPRWIAHWEPENGEFWHSTGKKIATRNLWFSIGHAHHGLTLAPVTGRLVADLVTGDTPFVDPSPYRADRF